MDAAAGSNPYPGLRPFQADETHLFFGRDEQRIELLHRLRQSRFLAIVGTSGSGKSSLVRAGLLPGLHGGFMAGQSVRWRVVDLRPGTDAIGNLARALDAPGALRDAPAAEDEPSFTEATLRRCGLGLVEAVREARLPNSEKVLVLVDQFEELFRAIEAADRLQSSDDASAFVKLLLEAAQQGELPIYVVLTMRSDFLGECSRFRDLPEAINGGQYLVPRLTPDQRSEAITGPAVVFGVSLSSTLVNRLLNDVGENPDQLPILQHALMRTWDQWQRRPADRAKPNEIGLADYEEIGGMARALSLHADAVFEGLADQRSPQEAVRQKAIAEKLFKCLAGIGAGGLAVRRLAKLQEIVDVSGAPLNEVISVIDAFRAAGHCFLMPPAGEPLTPERYLDISHESLIRNWVRMKTWVDDEAESARVYERLSSTAMLHDKGEAGLWDQPDLGVALKWRSIQKPNPAWAQRYNAGFGQAMAFLDASHARAQAAEEAKARRRRMWALSTLVVYFAMLTGILAWGREELARTDELLRQAREAGAELKGLKSIGELHRARAAGAVAGDAWRVCERPSQPAGTYSRTRQELLDKLCEPGSELSDDDLQLIWIYEHVVQGRWRDAGQGISQLGTDLAAFDGKQLLAQLAAMRSFADRSERSFLLELRDRQGVAATPSEAQRARIANLAHPVHRQIAAVLTTPSGRLLLEEKLLLDAYQEAEDARSTSRSAAARKRGRGIVEALRRQPHGHAYGVLGLVALSPESQVIEGFEAGMNFLRDYAWSIGVLIIWPAWRLRRSFQHRSGKPIRSKPNPMRRGVAAVIDFAIAAAIDVLAAIFIDSVVGIGGSLLKSRDLVDRLDAAGFASGLLAGAAYLLCRDTIRIRFRRSIGKAMFDLRPLVANGADPGAVTVWASMKRNAIVSAIWLLLLLSFALGDSWQLLAFAAMFFLLVDFARSWSEDGLTFGDKWSKTMVIDADSSEARSIRT